MILEKIVFQNNPPRNKNVIWAVPEGDKIVQRIWNNGNWVPVGGSGDSSGSSTTISQNITSDELQALYDSGVTKVTVEGIGEGVLQMSKHGPYIEFKERILYTDDLGSHISFKYWVIRTSDFSNSNTEENQENSVIGSRKRLEKVGNLATSEDVNLHALPNLTNVIPYVECICYLSYYNENATVGSSESVWSGTDRNGNLVQLFVEGTKQDQWG